MGMFDDAVFPAPNVNSVVPSLQNFLNYKNQRRQEDANDQMQFEKDLANFHSNLKLKEMTQMADQDRINRSREPLNVLPPTGLITPAMDAQIKLEGERNKAMSEYNMDRSRIAQQNADTAARGADIRETIGLEGLKTREAIANANNATRRDISTDTNATRRDVTDANIRGRSDLEDKRQTNRVTNLNTRGQQLLNNIGAKGYQDRLTKSTPSPNTANYPSQQLIDQKLKANEYINRHPEMAKWIQIDPNTNLVHFTPPSNETSMFGGAKGPGADAYHAAIAAILGPTNSYGTQAVPPVTTQPTTQPTQPSGDTVRVKLPDGRIGYMPRERANQPGIQILGGGQ